MQNATGGLVENSPRKRQSGAPHATLGKRTVAYGRGLNHEGVPQCTSAKSDDKSCFLVLKVNLMGDNFGLRPVVSSGEEIC